MIVKTQTLREPFDHIYSGDEALDSEAENFTETFLRAVETSDTSIIPVKSGQTPTRWTLRHLSSEEAAWLLDQAKVHGGGTHQMFRHAVALAVTGVEGARGSDGKPIRILRRADAGRRGFSCVDPEQMETIFGRHNQEMVEELGGRVFQSMRPPKG